MKWIESHQFIATIERWEEISEKAELLETP